MDAEAMKLAALFITPVGAVVIWLLRLEGRVNTNKALQDDLKDDVRYIRERIDRALNGHGHGV